MKPRDFTGLQPLLDKRQAAYMLGISVTTIDLMRKSRELRSLKIGNLVRFDSEDIKTFINRKKTHRHPLDFHITKLHNREI